MNLCEELHVCDWRWIGIRKEGDRLVDVYRCQVCGKEETRPYTGTHDMIEYRFTDLQGWTK